jgi:hypothetical protein
MQRKLTITIDEQVYEALHQQVGRGNISAFIEGLVRPQVYTAADLDNGYREMAADEETEREALEWADAFMNDIEL